MNNEEIYRINPESKRMIVFIHGIIEGPKQFRHLAQIAYHAGYSSYILLLPGHGGSGEKFGRTCYKEWVLHTAKQIQKLKKHYTELILVGHSMGALLALCESVSRPSQIKALVLIDTPLRIHVWPRVIKGAIHIALGQGELMNDYTKAEYHAISVKQPSVWGYLKWGKRYLELFTLIYYTRKQVKKVRKPMLLIFAKKDEFVSLKSRKYFERRYSHLKMIGDQELILKDSGHFCYHHEDLLKLEETFSQFIREMKKEEEVFK